MLHRKIYHPERFKFDMIACSECKKQVRAVDFDGHNCVAEEVSSWPAVDKMGDTCSIYSVLFSGNEIRYHDCKITSSVRVKRLRIKSKIGSLSTAKIFEPRRSLTPV